MPILKNNSFRDGGRNRILAYLLERNLPFRGLSLDLTDPGTELGQGSFGAVYACRDRDGKPCALKVIGFGKNGPIRSVRDAAVLSREVRQLRDLQGGCRQIIKVYAYTMLEIQFDDSYDDTILSVRTIDEMRPPENEEEELQDSRLFIFLLMEKLHPLSSGGLRPRILADRLRFLNGETWPDNGEAEVLCLSLDIARAMAYAHRHAVVHRDIKLDNILWNEEAYKLGDFGLARATENGNASSAAGTGGYQAPEVTAHRRGGYDACLADLYSFGITIYQLLNGRKLPKTDETEGLKPLSPPKNGGERFHEIVLKACARDPKARYASADELIKDLEELKARLEQAAKAGPNYLELMDTFASPPADIPSRDAQEITAPDVASPASEQGRLQERPEEDLALPASDYGPPREEQEEDLALPASDYGPPSERPERAPAPAKAQSQPAKAAGAGAKETTRRKPRGGQIALLCALSVLGALLGVFTVYRGELLLGGLFGRQWIPELSAPLTWVNYALRLAGLVLAAVGMLAEGKRGASKISPFFCYAMAAAFFVVTLGIDIYCAVICKGAWLPIYLYAIEIVAIVVLHFATDFGGLSILFVHPYIALCGLGTCFSALAFDPAAAPSSIPVAAAVLLLIGCLVGTAVFFFSFSSLTVAVLDR